MQLVLFIGKVWPEPASSAAGTRIMQLIDFFQQRGNKVSFASAASRTEHSADLQKLSVQSYDIELNSGTFDKFIAELSPGIVVFDRFTTEEQFGWRVTKHCQSALRILDTEDLHCLRYARQHALATQQKFEPEMLANDLAYREIASIYRCDVSLMISAFEMHLLESYFSVPVELLHYLPFCFERINNTSPPFKDRNDFVFIGNFYHQPNVDAAQWLAAEIWPIIHKQLPDAKLHIYGAYTSEAILKLHAPAHNLFIEGRAEKASTVMRTTRVSLAPLRIGAGLKGKIIDAVRNGAAVVTTSIGAEGMSPEKWPAVMAEEAEFFAEKAIELYSSEEQWHLCVQTLTGLFNSLFARDQNYLSFESKLSSINLKEHRVSNFTGSMLHYQSHHASQNLSKYIEEKNKRVGD